MKRMTQKSIAAVLTVWMLVGCLTTPDLAPLTQAEKIDKAKRTITGVVLGTNVLIAAIMIVDAGADVGEIQEKISQLSALAFSTIASINALSTGAHSDVKAHADFAIELFEADIAARKAELGSSLALTGEP